MKLKGKKVGVALTGSFCTYEKAFVQLRKLKEEGAEIVTIFSNVSQTIDSRFGLTVSRILRFLWRRRHICEMKNRC